MDQAEKEEMELQKDPGSITQELEAQPLPDDNEKTGLLDADELNVTNERANAPAAATTTYFETLMHLLKVSIGTGILGLPVAVMNAGVVVGPIALFLIALITAHTMLLLVESARKLCQINKVARLDYGETAEECVRRVHPGKAKLGRYIVNVTLCVTQIGVCTVYVLFVARNIEQVFWQLHVVKLRVELYIFMLCPIIVALVMIKNLSALALLSTVANCLMAFSIVTILVYLIPNSTNPSNLPMFAGWHKIPLFFGVAVFAFEAIPIILPLENSINNQKDFPSVVKVGMSIVLVIYVAMGVLGYLNCQETCKGSITLNLPGSTLFVIVKLLVATAVFFSYFIQAYVPLKIIEPWVFQQIPEDMQMLADTMMRALLAMFTCGLAAAVPQLHNIISLVGALSMSLLGFVFPSAIHTITFYEELSKLTFVKNCFIFIFGLTGSLAGTYVAVAAIIEDFGQHRQ